MPTTDRSSRARRDAVDTIAADWLSRRDAGLSAAEERELAAWLAADPSHAEAWSDVEASWQAFDLPRQIGIADEMMIELAARKRRRRWRVQAGAAIAFAAAACMAIGIFIGQSRQRMEPAIASTIVVRPETRTLADGSTVEMHTRAEVSINYTAERREVRLLKGEAFFSVAKDAARPFVVRVADVEVRAVGTAFAVKREAQGIAVLVTEGRVSVDDAASSAAPRPLVELVPGERLTLPEHGDLAAAARPEKVTTDEQEQWLAWRGPKLQLSGTPLAEAVAALNRENPVRIEITDAELAAMQLTGVFRADNAINFAQVLERHYGVVVERRSAHEWVLRKREER